MVADRLIAEATPRVRPEITRAGGADEAHREKNDRMGWAALWETLEVLSVPTVSIGAGKCILYLVALGQ